MKVVKAIFDFLNIGYDLGFWNLFKVIGVVILVVFVLSLIASGRSNHSSYQAYRPSNEELKQQQELRNKKIVSSWKVYFLALLLLVLFGLLIYFLKSRNS